MMKNSFLIVAILLLFTGFAEAETHELVSGRLSLVFNTSRDGIRLVGLKDTGANQEFLSDQPLPLFDLKLLNTQTDEQATVDSNSGWQSVKLTRKDASAELIWVGSKSQGLARLVVKASLELQAAHDRARWQIEVKNGNPSVSVLSVRFPQLKIRELGKNGSVFFPRAPGEVQPGLWRRPFEFNKLYPDAWASMQYLAAYNETKKSGLYVACHDPAGQPKWITVKSSPSEQTVDLRFEHPAADQTRGGNDYSTQGEVVWQLFAGDWFDATQIYRNWVHQDTPWFIGPGPEGREDTSRWMRELPGWLKISRPQDIPKVKEILETIGVPLGVHWYCWHQIPFDNDYPHYFPPQEQFVEGVRELQEAGARVMPYINGRLWDTRDRGGEDYQFSRHAKSAATIDAKGELYIEKYGANEEDGSPVKFAVMCPASRLWQKRLGDIIGELFDRYQVDAVYVDQVAAMPPKLCMDPAHGHTLGGGGWWNQGYWKMFQKIRAKMPPDRVLTAECNAEPFAHVFDGFLSWQWQYENQVPAFQAVYAGAIQCFGRKYGDGPTQDEALRMKAGQQLVYGEQIGWMSPDIVPPNSQNLSFFKKIVRLRWKLGRYFFAGRMQRPPQLTELIPKFQADWQWRDDWVVTSDAVLTGAWSQPQKNKSVLLFVNVSDERVASDVLFERKDFSPKQTELFVRRITAEKDEEFRPFRPGVPFRVDLAPRDAEAWEIKAVGQ